jgi:hypothetical protein
MDSPEKKREKLVISTEDLDETAELPAAPERPPVQVKPKAAAKPKAPKAAPAAKKAPTAAPVPPGRKPWYHRHAKELIFGTGLVAALAVGFLVSFVLLGLFDSADDRTREALADGAGAFESVTAEVGRATGAAYPFTALSETAAASDGRASAVDDAAQGLADKVDDERLVAPATEALDAERQFLVRLSAIAEFPLEKLASRWRKLEPELRQSQRRIDAARQPVLSLGLGGEAGLMPPNADITAAIGTTGSIIDEAERRLSRWRSERSDAEAEVGEIESYKGSMAQLIDEYYEQRDVTRELVNEPAVRWDDAADTLDSHAAARQSIIDRMNALFVPPGVESAHAQMVSLATESRQLLIQASEEARTDPFIIWTGSPGYHRFSAESDGITAQFDPAKSAVLGGADSAIASAKAEVARVGPRPQV